MSRETYYPGEQLRLPNLSSDLFLQKLREVHLFPFKANFYLDAEESDEVISGTRLNLRWDEKLKMFRPGHLMSSTGLVNPAEKERDRELGRKIGRGGKFEDIA